MNFLNWYNPDIFEGESSQLRYNLKSFLAQIESDELV